MAIYSTIDCNDCRNYWITKVKGYKYYITGTHCQGDVNRPLFHDDVKTKLSKKMPLIKL